MDSQEHPWITMRVIEDDQQKMSRKEKRKAMKKMKRKQVRKEIAIKEKEEEEARLNDPEEQLRLARLQQEEAERMEKERIEFEERERHFLQALERRLQSHQQLINEDNEDDGWEYVEEGAAEIIWKGNEIIVKKKKVRVPKIPLDLQKPKQVVEPLILANTVDPKVKGTMQECERPISNPLAPQSEAYENHVLQSVAQQVPNFGTEQDKEHCPFHLKTGVCRFGTRCSRVHFYPDKACTLLLKNMYHGPGLLAWEQDEGLEYTDEEAERSFEDFYEDVHTEFLKFGEIVNFKVCRNGSSHLRGNVYVHYKSLESAMLAYQSINGRYFAGKQLTCEFVNVTRWRVAICGEYMKSKLRTCSRGSTCNFIHCFRNPCGDYEWADWDKPAPRYWLKSMAALFGYNGDRFTDEVSPRSCQSRYSRSRGLSSPREDDGHRRRSLWRHRDDDRKADNLAEVMQGRKNMHQDYHFIKHRKADDGDISDGSTDGQRSYVGMRRRRGKELDSIKQDRKSGKGDAFSAKNESVDGGSSNRYLGHDSASSSRQKRVAKSAHEHLHNKDDKHEQGENIYTHKHHDTFIKHKGKHFSQEKKEADSSNVQTRHDSQDSGVDKHRRHNKKNLRRMKNESDLSSSASDESRPCRVKERSLKSRRKSSKLKSKSNVAEIGSDEDSLDCYKDRQHRCGKKYSTLASNISESSDGGDRLGRDEKRRRKSIRIKDKSVTDSESDKDEGRHHRHRKMHSKQRKHDADSSDSSCKYERRPQKSRRTSSRSHKESGVINFASNGERIGGEERRHRHRSSAEHHIKDCGSSEVDSNAFSQFRSEDIAEEKGETDAGNFENDVRRRSSYADLNQNLPEQESTDDHEGVICRFSDTEKCYDSIDGPDVGLVSGKDIKRFDNEHMLQINKSDAEAYVSGKVETFSVSTIYQDFDAEAEAELEKACRHAALQKLEEIKRDKDTQAVRSREPAETSRIFSHEQIVVKGVDVSAVEKESGSSKLETSVASVQRRRI